MKPLEDIYKASFFSKRHKLAWRVPIVCGAIARNIEFDSVVDVGCAIGDLVKGFADIGKSAIGIEGSERALPYAVTPKDLISFSDLRKPFPTLVMFDLATCLEVAEHIEPEYARQFVANITGLSRQILVSIAPPGQGGHYHVNCQPIEYWDDLFSLFGYVRLDSYSEAIKKEWEPYKKKDGIRAYYQNLHFYQEKST